MVSKLHIFGPTADNSVRIRAYCPICKHQKYGRYTMYYDTAHVTLNCGFFIDFGYGVVRGHRGPRGGQPLWRNKVRLKEWGWNASYWISKVPVKPW